MSIVSVSSPLPIVLQHIVDNYIDDYNITEKKALLNEEYSNCFMFDEKASFFYKPYKPITPTHPTQLSKVLYNWRDLTSERKFMYVYNTKGYAAVLSKNY